MPIRLRYAVCQCISRNGTELVTVALRERMNVLPGDLEMKMLPGDLDGGRPVFDAEPAVDLLSAGQLAA